METRAARIGFGVWTALVVCFLWAPLIVIAIYAFNNSAIQSWPISGWTFHWFRVAWEGSGVRSALWLSVKIGLAATAIAVVLGSMSAFAPLALPGIITGLALNSFFTFASQQASWLPGIPFSMWTIVLGHATFCVVVVYNNVLARLRRTAGSLVEASMDLGADGWQTFRYVTWPTLSTALVGGALLAFALSFDEVIVTTFTAGAQTPLPIFIFDNINRGTQLPVINVVAFVVILLTVIPVWASVRLTHTSGLSRRS